MAWRIKTVTERTGVPAETLRSWERRYGLLKPARSASGYRQYSDADVALIARLKELIDSGLAISEAVARCAEDVEPAPPPRRDDSMREARRRLLQALLDGDEVASAAILTRLSATGWSETVDTVLLPVAREASWLAAQGQATPGEAAFVRGWLRDRLVAMRVGLGVGPESAPSALLLRLPGGSEVAQQGFAIGLRLLGWRATVLCEGLPLVDAAVTITRRSPALVVLFVDPDASEGAQRTELGRLEALAPTALLRAHGVASPGPAGRAHPIVDPSELPTP
jgi:MerR family transcriptional regulator, light-induced transcriptional regulator